MYRVLGLGMDSPKNLKSNGENMDCDRGTGIE